MYRNKIKQKPPYYEINKNSFVICTYRRRIIYIFRSNRTADNYFYSPTVPIVSGRICIIKFNYAYKWDVKKRSYYYIL